MAYQQFMYEEAFDFHDKNAPHTTTKTTTMIEEDEDEFYDVEDRRLPPLGACSNDETSSSQEGIGLQKFLKLQEEHEQLNVSLYALTSHFAQVQFRLKQIINGPKGEQENLLTELEDFAFTGCPDVLGPNEKAAHCCSDCNSKQAIVKYEENVNEEREREQRLENHLKKMISDLESCQKQFEAGGAITKKRRSLRKKDGYQQARLDSDSTSSYMFEEMNQLDISDDEIDGVPQEDIKKHVDKTMAKLINPHKAKDKVIAQVSKQIHDMEKFVSFLQTYESTTEVETDAEPVNSRTSMSKNTARSTSKTQLDTKKNENKIPAPHTKILQLSEEKRKRLHEASVAVMKKSLAVLQIFAISQFGCSAKHFREHMMKRSETATVSSTGHVKPLTSLRNCIDQVMMLHTKLVDIGGLHPDSDDELNLPISSTDKRAAWKVSRTKSVSRSRQDSESSVASTSVNKSHEVLIQEELIRVVRSEFCQALKELLQHGLCTSFTSGSLSTKALVGCMSSHVVQGHGMHIWEYFKNFYQLKHGSDFNTQPSMTLSEAFAMDVGCTKQTPKQSLLTVLHRIRTTHETRKRSFDAMFKALISAGLNRGRLAQWIRLVIRCPELTETHYERWSYVVRTGFDEVLTLLEKVSTLTFFLPEDLAIRHLLKNSNEFGDA